MSSLRASEKIDIPTEEVMGNNTSEEVIVAVKEGGTLKKSFNFFSILALSVSLMATWEALPCVFITGLVSGGPVSLLYGFILAFTGTMATCSSLSEMASMYPTSGGQYHWVAQLSPRKQANFFAWIAGWISNFGWLLITGSVAYLSGTMIQGVSWRDCEQ